MTITSEQVARALGMKPREVVRWDGTVATLHDGTRFEFNAAGEYRQLERVQRETPRAAGSRFVADWTAPESAGIEVPAGSEKDLLAWVGADQARAARALAVEKVAEKPRAGVVAKLEKLVGD